MSDADPQDPQQDGSDNPNEQPEFVDGDKPVPGVRLRPGEVGIVYSKEKENVTVPDTIRLKDGDTTRRMAWFLLWSFILTYLAHTGLIIWLGFKQQSAIITQISTIYDKLLPVLTGFAGSAVTYFLTKKDVR